jgi:very-short-patch-repair endonuclease
MLFGNRYKKPYQQPPPSPIERSFWETAKPLIPELEREVWIDKYRVDFLIPSKKIIIELYGYEHHNTKQKLAKDAERERYLQRLGYQMIIRFTGTEVFKDVGKCVSEVLLLADIQPASPFIIPTGDKPINTSSQATPSAGTTVVRGIVGLLLLLTIGFVACSVVIGLSTLMPSSIRTGDHIPDAELKRAITHSTLEWQNPRSPGKTEWQVTIPANEPGLINWGWCATDKTTLDENWSQIHYSLLVDNSYVELGSKQWDFENEEGVCRGYSEPSKGWPVGRHSFTWLYTLDRMLHNGKDGYEPGEYIIEFIVEVE